MEDSTGKRREMGKSRAEIRSMPTHDIPSKGADPSTFVHHKNASTSVKSTSIWTQRKRSMWASSWSAAFLVGLLAMLTTYFIVPSSWTTVLTPSSTLMIPIPPPPSSDQKILSFLHWFHTEGGISHKITITTFSDMGRGILATGPIHEHDVLLNVPNHLILCRETILNHVKAPSGLVQKFQKLSDRSEELLTAFLLLEQINTTTNGYWAPYLALLPPITSATNVMTPLLYPNESIITQLQDESMITAATTERQQAKLAYQRFRRLFRSFLPSSSSQTLFSLYQWTRFLIQSRAFSIHGQRYLVPYGDFFNNQPHPEPRVMSNGQSFLQYHQLQAGKGMEIRSDRFTRRGNQVFEDYGDNTNDIYMLYHGFIQEYNVFDCSMISLPVLSLSLATDQDSALGQSKLAVLRHYNIQNGPQVCVTARGKILSKQEEWIWEMYGHLSRLDAKEMELCGHRARYEYCFGIFNGQKQKRSRRRRLKTHKIQQLELLLKGILLQLKKYPTTSLQDEALLLRTQEDLSLKHAIRFRLHRKQVLEHAIVSLTRRLDQIQKEKTQLPSSVVVDNVDTSSLSLEDRMNRFNEWVQRLELPTNHLRVGYVDEISGYGVYTTKILKKGEVYLRVPTKYVLNIDSAIESAFIQELLTQDIDLNDFELLLLHLLDEKFSTTSQWKPYLDILPDPSRLASTSLYYEETGPELELLSHSSVDLHLLINDYRKTVEMAFTTLSTRLNHLKTKPHWLTKENVQWAMAMLDSRSIWWSGQRHLVPLLDMVNCMEVDGKEQSLHTTTLETVVLKDGEEENVAVTRASWAFTHGTQLVENYGQPNYIYLLYHGFVLSRNSYDCAHYHFDFHALSMEKGVKRTEAIKTLERWGLFTWTPDVCVTPYPRSSSGSPSHTVETLIQLAALTAPQVDASSLHVAALEATRTRLHSIIKILRAFELNERYTNTMVWKYLQQQQQLLQSIEQTLVANY